jgi:hypothetical protein
MAGSHPYSCFNGTNIDGSVGKLIIEKPGTEEKTPTVIYIAPFPDYNPIKALPWWRVLISQVVEESTQTLGQKKTANHEWKAGLSSIVC